MYNPDVSEVHVYVTKANSKSPVQGEVEKYVKEFAQSGCPSYTREILAPFRILDPPHSKYLFTKVVSKWSKLKNRNSRKNYLIVCRCEEKKCF